MRTNSRHSGIRRRSQRRAAPLRPLVRLAILTSLLALPLASAAPTERATVAVSIHPYASLVRQIGGDALRIVQVLPSGASPHTFDPSPSQVTAVAGASLIVMNGGTDAWMRKIADAAAPRAPVFVVTDELTYTPIQGNEQGAGANPHVWLDPRLMVDLVPKLVDALVRLDPADAPTLRANGDALSASLRALDAHLESELAPLRGAPFVPFHDAWPYFARRYGLDLVASLEPAPGRDPSPRYVAAAVAKIRATGARAVFDEAQLNPRPAEVVAQSAGVDLVTLDPIGTDEQSYQQLMLANAATIKRALGP